MGKPTLQPEKREQAKALYMLGVPPTRVALKCGVPAVLVRQWALRLGWTKEKLSKQQANSAIVEQAHGLVLTDAILDHQNRVGKIYQANLDRLAALKMPVPRSAKEYVDTAAALDAAQRRNLGIVDPGDAGAAKNTFNFNLAGVKMSRSQVVDISTQVVDNSKGNGMSSKADSVSA